MIKNANPGQSFNPSELKIVLPFSRSALTVAGDISQETGRSVGAAN